MTAHLTHALAQRFAEGVEPMDRAAGAHLEACAACRALVADYRVLADALNDLDLSLPPRDFTDGVLARIAAREARLSWERRLAFAVLAVSAVAAAACFVLAGQGPLAAQVARWSRDLSGALVVWRVGEGVLGTIAEALRLPIVLACAGLCIPLLVALRRLVPERAAERVPGVQR